MKTREWLILESLNVVKRVLSKSQITPMKTNIRKPTIKEVAKHPKLLRKQRARFRGV